MALPKTYEEFVMRELAAPANSTLSKVLDENLYVCHEWLKCNIDWLIPHITVLENHDITNVLYCTIVSNTTYGVFKGSDLYDILRAHGKVFE